MNVPSSRRFARLALAATIPLMLLGAAPPAQVASFDGHNRGGTEKVAYFIEWGIYGRQFYVKNLVTSGSAARLTTLDYAFGAVNASGQCAIADSWADYQRPVSASESVDGVADAPGQALNGNFNQLRKLKAAYPNLHVLISLGGFTGSGHFSDAALTDASRQALVSSCIDLFIKGNLPGAPGAAAGVFDGIDLDWEWPGTDTGVGNVVRPQDKQDFTLLAAEFRKELNAAAPAGSKPYRLTAFLPADPAKVQAGFEIPKVLQSLDFATLQGYDLHGPWETTTNFQAALRAPKADPTTPVKFSDELTVQTYLDLGASPRKLVLGVPFYSHGWTGVPATNNGLFQTSTGPAAGRFDPPGGPYSGTEDYKVVATMAGFQLYRDRQAGSAWVYNPTTQTFWTFDDPIAMDQKARFIRRLDLRGAMAWELSGDTADGSLLRAIDQGLSRGEGEGD